MDPLKLTDEQLFAQALVRMQEEAKGSLSKFYSMVIKHELKKEPLVPAHHQELMFDFVEHHHKCVIRMPVGTGKTFSMAALALWLLGNNPTERWAIVSGSQGLAQKVLKMVSDYISDSELSSDLSLVFPKLQPSKSPNDSWSTKSITVERAAGIRDPSLVAVGVAGKIVGSRISGLVADDLLDAQSTRTEDARATTITKLQGELLPRLDPHDSRAIITNTPWHYQDATYQLEGEGWATLTMDIYGFIRISNVSAEWLSHALNEYIRPSQTRRSMDYDWYRLKAFDPDPEEKEVLWKERMPLGKIEELRYGGPGVGAMPPHEFACAYMCNPFKEDAARCQRDWIEKAKLRGMGLSFLHEYDGPNPTATGIDLAVGKTASHDSTVFFTIMIDEDGSRHIIDIQSGKYSGPEIIDILLSKAERYNSIIAVESNSAQKYIEEFARDRKKDLRIIAHTTTKANKYTMDFGVESIFTELQNGAWVIPCERGTAQVHPEIKKWVDNCLFYQPPPAHTGDFLMACWIAREAIRKKGGGLAPPTVGQQRQLVRGGAF